MQLGEERSEANLSIADSSVRTERMIFERELRRLVDDVFRAA
jgi:hypothetical protein